MPRAALIMLLLGLLAATLRLGAIPSAMAQPAGEACRSAGVALWQAGDKRLEYYQDGYGHDVEVWCASGIFTAHYDLRVGWHDPAAAHGSATASDAARRQSLTVAGCFFNHGTNDGPNISRGPDGAYSKVEWTNTGPPGEQTRYHFSYDFHTRLVTITAVAPCGTPVTKVVAPQPNFQKLEAVLPDPPAGACNLRPAATTQATLSP